MSSKSVLASGEKRQATMPLSRSLGLAILLEAILLSGAATLIAQAKAITPHSEPQIMIAVDDLKPPPEEAPRPEPVRQVVRQAQPKPASVPQASVHELPPEPLFSPAPAAPSLIAEAPVRETPHPTPRDNGDREAEFAMRLKASIQAAVVYPAAARAMGFSGRARLEFQFRDGLVSHLRVVQSSGSGMIDQAALASVGNAVVPPIPESIKGRDLTYQVTVEFQLKSER